LVQIFWVGAQQYLRVKWLDRGMSPEESSLDKLVKWAIRFEKSKEAMDREDRDWKPKPKGNTWGRFQNRTTGNEPWKPEGPDAEREGDRKEKPKAKVQAPAKQGTSGSKFSARDAKAGGKPKSTTPRLSAEEKDKMRAEDRCFNCRDIGHQSRNCPKKHEAKASKVSVGSARYEYLNSLGLDKLVKAKRAAALRLDSVRVEAETEGQNNAGTDTNWLSAPAAEVCEYLKKLWISAYPDHEAVAENLQPGEQFSVHEYGISFEVIDWVHTEVSYMVTREDLSRADFDVHNVVNDAWDAHFSAPRQSSFQGDEPNHEYPALSWLLFQFAGALCELEGLDMDAATDRIVVDPATGGHLIFDETTADHYFVTHDEIRVPGFSPKEVLCRPPPDETPTMESIERIRRRRRIMARPRCSVASVKAKQPRKKRKVERNEATEDHMSRNSMTEKDVDRKLPKQVIVEAFINGQSVRAMMDTGSMMDFISTRLVDQLKIPKEVLVKPVPLFMAVSGSRSKVNCSVTANLQYQGIDTSRTFDVVNLDSYDVVLGTPFLFQHKVAVGPNPTRVVVGSNEPLPLEGDTIVRIISAAAEVCEDKYDNLRRRIREEVADLCQDPAKTALPPFRAVNHKIPLIDDNKVYSWRPSKCPEALKPLWREKKDIYLKSGRWRVATGTNAVPMLIIKKPGRDDGVVRIRTPVDKREINANTRKFTAPLPDQEGILKNVVRHPIRSLVDGKDFYEQIRIVDEHVSRTLFVTPDGTMESLVLHLGDFNGGATCQLLMNHIFSEYIGVLMDVYLDDIIIYSDTPADHIAHLREIFAVLRREKLYLSPDKMQLFASELKVLGHVVDDDTHGSTQGGPGS
jgi:hypothetical protein